MLPLELLFRVGLGFVRRVGKLLIDCGGNLRGVIRRIDLDDVPADLTLLNRPFIGVLPVEHHRLVVHRTAAGPIDAPNRKIVVLRAVRGDADLEHDPIAKFPPEASRQAVAHDAARSIVEKCLFLIRCQSDLRIHPQVAFRLDRELGEEILGILVDAAKPVGPRDVLHAGRAADAVGVTRRHREDQRRRTDRHNPRRRTAFRRRVEAVEHGAKRREQKHGKRHAEDREHRPALAPSRTLQNQ